MLWRAVRSGRLALVRCCLNRGCDPLVVSPELQGRCERLDKASLEAELGGVTRNLDALRLLVTTMRRASP